MEALCTVNSVLRYRLRSDIQWTEIEGNKRSWWIATDPLRSQHFRCSAEERKLLQLLSQSKSLEEWKDLYNLKNPGHKIHIRDLQQMLRRFVDSGLLLSFQNQDTSDNLSKSTSQTAKPLHKQSGFMELLIRIEQLPWRLFQSRWSLGNPHRYLKSIAGYTDLAYSNHAVIFWFACFAIVLVSILFRGLAEVDPLAWHPSKWTLEVPWHSLGNCAAILMVTRIFHELGHAIVATRYGAKVQNIGLFWTLGIACPYVDVSDAWRLRSRNQRIFVSLAGIYTEMIVATIAGTIWLNTLPCALHTICWQTLIICSLMTLAININPLVRYDGYFALSDFLEVANLKETCNSALRKCFVDSMGSARVTLSDFNFAILGILSSLYRVTITFTFAFAVLAIGKAWELNAVGVAIAASLIVSSFVLPIVRSLLGAYHQKAFVNVRFAVGVILLLSILSYAITLPLPSYVPCEGSVGWSEQSIIYTQEAGHIISLKPFRMDNAWLRFQNHSAIEQSTELDSKVNQARLAMYSDPDAGYPIEGLILQSKIAEENRRQLAYQLSRLNNVTIPDQSAASTSDSISAQWYPVELPPPDQIDAALESGFGQPSRSTFGYSVQDDLNIGRWLPAGTPIGVLLRGDKVRITATVQEEILSQIQPGSKARVILAPYPDRVLLGTVISTSELSSLEISQAISKPKIASPQAEPVQMDKDKDAAQSYGVVIEIDSEKGSLNIDKSLYGAAASVVVETTPKTIVDRVSQYAQRVIRK